MKRAAMICSRAVLAGALLLNACARAPETMHDCADISAGCRVDGVYVSSNHPPQILKPFELRMEIHDPALITADQVYASFGMEGMEMGLNRYRLIKKAEGLWVAEVNLPACVRGWADWTMLLELHDGMHSQRFMIGFQTKG